MTSIAVVDHGAGNLVSIAQALRRTGAEVSIATDPSGLTGVSGVVLPGVGATGAAMARLRSEGLVEPLQTLPVPLLGICVGLQVLFEESDEDGAECLGLLPGTVTRLGAAPRLPHIGWNELDRAPDPLFTGLADEATFYFVHSYAPVPADPSVVIARTTYGTRFVAAVRSGSIAGVQFHPERSGRNGLIVLDNFVTSCRDAARAA